MSLYRLLIELVGKDKGATQTLKSAQKEVTGLERAAGSLQGALTAVAGIAGMAYVGKQALDLVSDLYMLGAQAMRTEQAFGELAKGAGGSADAILSAIKRASGGTVSEMDAMMSANKGMLLGLGANAQQWEELTEVARYRARAMGLTVTQALNDITTGIGRESRMILDNLGIVLDMDAVMKQYASTLGKTVGELDAFERKQAMVTGIIEETQAQAAAAGVALGNMANDQVDAVEAQAAAWENLKVQAGKTVAEIDRITEGITRLTSILDQGFGKTLWEDMIVSAQEGSKLDRVILDLLGSFNALPGYVDEVRESLYGLAPWMSGMGDDARQAGYAVRGAADATYNLSGAISSLTGPMSQVISLGDQFEQTWLDIGAAANALGMELDAVMRDISAVSGEELVVGFRGDISGLDAALLGISGMAPATTINRVREEYQAELRSLYDAVAWQIEQGGEVSEFQIELQARGIYDKYKGVIDAIEDSTSGIEGALKDQNAAWENLKSAVEAALQPTRVTALDVAQTEAGIYADKWDEDARRLDAIAARGFGELDAHPDWAGILGIPPEILNSTEDVLKEWARQQSDNFRNLLLPLGPEDVAAAVERVRDYIQQQAQREQNIETIALAYQAEYGGTEEQARAALGDTEAIGGIAADDVIAGFTDALEAASPAGQFQSYFKDDIEDQTKNLNTRGTELWQKIEKGLLDEMHKGNYVDAFAQILAPYVEQRIRENGPYRAGNQYPP